MARSRLPLQITLNGATLAGRPQDIIQELIGENPLFSMIMATSSLAIFYVDRDLTLQFAQGRGVEGLLKLQQSEWIGKKIDRLFSQDHDFVSAVQRALKGEITNTVVKVSPFTFEIHFELVRNIDQEIHGVLGIAANVTERFLFHQALQESEQLFQAVFNHAPVGVMILSLEGTFIDFNPTTEAILECTHDQLAQKNLCDLIQPAERARIENAFNRLAQGMQKELRLDCHLVAPNGRKLWGRFTASLVQHSAGDSGFVISLLEDISKYKQSESDAHEVQRKLLLGREQERLSMAQELHDGPLQDLIGTTFMLEAIKDDNHDTQSQAQLENARQSLQSVIDHIRSICGNLRPPALTPLGLEKAIRSHADTFKGQHPEIRIYLNLSQDGQRLGEKIRIAIYRVYQESMNNIARHANARNVWVWLNLNEDHVVLEIRDDGQGFALPPRWVQLVRAGHFGLAGAKERMEAINAEFEIESQPGQGTFVRLKAPIAQSDVWGDGTE